MWFVTVTGVCHLHFWIELSRQSAPYFIEGTNILFKWIINILKLSKTRKIHHFGISVEVFSGDLKHNLICLGESEWMIWLGFWQTVFHLSEVL